MDMELANRKYENAMFLINSALESFLNFCDICGDDEDDLEFDIATESRKKKDNNNEQPATSNSTTDSQQQSETKENSNTGADTNSGKKTAGVKAAVKAMFAAIAEWFRNLFGKGKAAAIVPKNAKFGDTEATLAELEKMLESCMSADTKEEFTKRINAFDEMVKKIKTNNEKRLEENLALVEQCKSENNFFIRIWPFSIAHHEMKCHKIIDKECEWSNQAASRIKDIIDVARMDIMHGQTLDKARKNLGKKFDTLEKELAKLKLKDEKSNKSASKFEKHIDKAKELHQMEMQKAKELRQSANSDNEANSKE